MVADSWIKDSCHVIIYINIFVKLSLWELSMCSKTSEKSSFVGLRVCFGVKIKAHNQTIQGRRINCSIMLLLKYKSHVWYIFNGSVVISSMLFYICMYTQWCSREPVVKNGSFVFFIHFNYFKMFLYKTLNKNQAKLEAIAK